MSETKKYPEIEKFVLFGFVHSDDEDEPLWKIFLSHRRLDRHLAGHLKTLFEEAGIRCFLDVDDLRAGRFDTQCLKALKLSELVVVLLTPNSLERMKEPEDMLAREIEEAMKLGKKIIPIFTPDFHWPTKQEKNQMVPKKIQEFLLYAGVEWNHTYRQTQEIVQFTTSPKE